MMKTSTNEIETMLQHFVGGDQEIWRVLVNQIVDRLRWIVKKERKKYVSGVANDDTDSILSNAYIKMSRREADLREVLARTPPPFVRRFFCWCGQQIRDVLTRDQRQRVKHDERLVELRDIHASPVKEGATEIHKLTEVFFAVSQLSESDQELFDLLHIHELPLAEIAEFLGVDISTVKRRNAKLKLQIAAICRRAAQC